jgi:hypothetical protein
MQFFQIENVATGDDYLGILINNIWYERKKSDTKKKLYLNIKDDYDLLHEGAHLEMLY